MSNFPDLIFKEHMQTLFLLEDKYKDMREDVSSFMKKYVLLYAQAIMSSSPTGILVKSMFKVLAKRMAKKLNIRLGKTHMASV